MSTSNKYALAEQVIRILQSGNPSDDTELDLREVAMYVEQSFNSIIRRRLFDERNESFQWMNGSYLYTFKNIAVVKDEDLDMFYSVVPATTIDLPNDMGIQYVGYMQNQSESIKPVPPNFQSLYSGLVSSSLEGHAGYYVEGERIYFVNWAGLNDACKVLIKMFVVSLDGSDSDAFAIDECNLAKIPIDMQEEIVRRTVEMYQIHKQIPKDTTNDNIDG